MDAITITAAMVLSLFDTNIGGDQFIYNTEFNNRQEVCAKTVFKKDEEGYFQKELRYQYAYDAQKRLSAKEVQAWNPAADKWENVYRLEYRYDLLHLWRKYRTLFRPCKEIARSLPIFANVKETEILARILIYFIGYPITRESGKRK